MTIHLDMLDTSICAKILNHGNSFLSIKWFLKYIFHLHIAFGLLSEVTLGGCLDTIPYSCQSEKGFIRKKNLLQSKSLKVQQNISLSLMFKREVISLLPFLTPSHAPKSCILFTTWSSCLFDFVGPPEVFLNVFLKIPDDLINVWSSTQVEICEDILLFFTSVYIQCLVLLIIILKCHYY